MSLLEKSIAGNGVFSLVAGVLAVVLAGRLSSKMGVSDMVLYVIGVGVALYGILLLVSARGSVGLGFALGVIGADVAWVIGAVVVLAIPGLLTGEGNLILGVVSAVVLAFAIMQTVGLNRATAENPLELVTEVEIAASPAEVWVPLTDLGSHREWNPFIVDAHGDPAEGGRLELTMQPANGKAMSFTPRVTEVSAPATLEWLGHLIRPGIFDGRHRFELTSTETGTRMVQSETFTGILVPALARSLSTNTRAGFEAMNAALKERVELGVRHSD